MSKILNEKDADKQIILIEEITKQKNDNLNRFILSCEDNFYNQINEVAKLIDEDEKIKIVLVAGPSSSGKTTTSNILMKTLEQRGQHSIVVSLDDFFVNRVDTPKLPNGRYDYESPNALDKNCLNIFIKELIEQKHSFKPVYDFVSGERKKEYEEVCLTDNTIVLIEGIHAHNPELIKTHKENLFKLYICPNSNFVNDDNKVILPAKSLRLMRRCLRDFYSRGHSISATLNMWEDVLAGEDLYIKPYKKYSSYIIDSTHAFEPFLYKNYLLPILRNAPKNELCDELIQMIDNFQSIDKNLIPKDSLIWEFLVD